jgi:hypothetical protein
LVYEGLELGLAAGLELELLSVLEHLGDASAAEGIERFASRGSREER